MPRDITGEDADLAVRDLARRAGILPPNATRGLALLQESGFIEDQNRVVVGERLKRIVPHGIAQVVGFPPAPAQNGLLSPRARITRRLRPHPARLALLIAKQAVQERPCRSRNPLLRKQRTHPRLHIPQGRRPKVKRCLNRCPGHCAPSESLRYMISEMPLKCNCNVSSSDLKQKFASSHVRGLAACFKWRYQRPAR